MVPLQRVVVLVLGWFEYANKLSLGVVCFGCVICVMFGAGYAMNMQLVMCWYRKGSTFS